MSVNGETVCGKEELMDKIDSYGSGREIIGVMRKGEYVEAVSYTHLGCRVGGKARHDQGKTRFYLSSEDERPDRGGCLLYTSRCV